MKLSELWKSYKKLSGIKNRTLYCNLSPTVERCLLPFCILLIFFISSFSGCEEKIPTLQIEKPFVDFCDLNVSSDSMIDTTQRIDPILGSSTSLFVGKNDHVNAFSLMRFSPDSLDSILSVSLRLKPVSHIFSDPVSDDSVSLTVSLLKDDWSEESSNRYNFQLSDFILEALDTITYNLDDTSESYLSFKLPDTILKFWRDTLNTNSSIVIQMADTNQQFIQTFNSSESASDPPILHVEYINNGDSTSIMDIPASADVSIINFYDTVSPAEQLQLSDGIASHSFLKFDLPDLILNENLVVGKALLHLSIDTLETENYDKDFYLYLSLIDSSEWGNLDYSPLVEEADAYYKVNSGDSTLIISIGNVVQQITSGYHENLGLVIWSSSSTFDLSVLSVYSSSYSDSLKRPYLEILVMEEK